MFKCVYLLNQGRIIKIFNFKYYNSKFKKMDNNPKKIQLVYKKMLETRFADPVTAIDLSLRHVCFGSAMGRLAFYDIKADKDVVISDSQPELIRGVSSSSTFLYHKDRGR